MNCIDDNKTHTSTISDSIRSSSNNDSSNNTNSRCIVTGVVWDHQGECETQFQEADRENITFLELCLWSPLVFLVTPFSEAGR